jgi:predicted RecA/RadA family phage recombinase
MKNQKYTHADHIAVTAPSGGVTSGQAVRIGALAGVAVTTQPEGAQVAIWLDGSYTLEVAGALTEGQVVYIKSDNSLTATASGNNPFGTALVAKGSGTGPAEIAPFGNNPAVAVAAA